MPDTACATRPWDPQRCVRESSQRPHGEPGEVREHVGALAPGAGDPEQITPATSGAQR